MIIIVFCYSLIIHVIVNEKKTYFIWSEWYFSWFIFVGLVREHLQIYLVYFNWEDI